MPARRLFCAFILLFGLGSTAMNAQTFKPTEIDALHRLDDATDWLVRYGSYVVAMRGKDFLKSKLHQLGPVLLWVTPLLDEADTIAEFRIKAAGYNFDISAIYRDVLGGDEYLYWVTHVSSQDWATPHLACRFHVTRTLDDGKGEMVQRSETFLPSIRTASGDLFELPLNDLKIRYALQAWEYPACFALTDLPTTVIDFDETGKLVAYPSEG